MTDHATLIRELRRRAHSADPTDRAATLLLIEHDYWLRRPDFVAVAVLKHGTAVVIEWRAAREFFDSGPLASTSQLAILDLAVSLGLDRYRFAIMGDAHVAFIERAVHRAFGEVVPDA